MLGVINIRGDRLYHGECVCLDTLKIQPYVPSGKHQSEHIWWDQGTVLLQAGLIPTHLPYPVPDGHRRIRLPVAGAESARLLADETDGKTNEMFGEEWGVVIN
jgi:carboxymethylenebutenolidase